ncbi:MAG: PilC/PilY family type IV pilus protein [Hydrogenophaga sp.]|nr:PilC/PilY family type IV pilus protein [Hydrogenophaga sp.]
MNRKGPCAHRAIHVGLVLLAGTSMCTAVLAEPLLLMQHPPRLSREPAPNVIVSVDNSSSLSNSGLQDLKTGLKTAFSEQRLDDGRIRLAWQAMHGCQGIPGNAAACQGHNAMRPLDSEHRQRFMTWADGLSLSKGTPSHGIVDTAGQYLSATGLGIDSPWASIPGKQTAPLLACRQAHHVFLSDGAWGHASSKGVDTAGPDHQRIARGDNPDNSPIGLPDGTGYSGATSQTRVYRDAWGTSGWSTLSDLAFHYWSHDLQPDLPDRVAPRWRVPEASENFGTDAAPAPLDPYWNPRNDPATWQHLVTHTIGLRKATDWTVQPTWAGDHFTGLAPLIRGDVDWASPFCNDVRTGPGNLPCDGADTYKKRQAYRKPELWHMALNSRGRFLPAPDGPSLVDALGRVLEDITPTDPPRWTSLVGSASRLRADGMLFMAGFDARRWSGELSAHRISATTHAVDEVPTWRASALLDSPDLSPAQRLILTHSGNRGVAFEWAQLSSAQKDLLRGEDSEIVGRRRVSYLRGDRFLESQYGKTMRQRSSRLGDIVNSNLWHTGRPLRPGFDHPGHADFRTRHASRRPMVYVGANDGMLHAFDAQTGAERLAYLPLAVFGMLRDYTLPSYTHRYSVDGHPFTGDADLRANDSAPPDWRTVLVTGLGSGGRGYIVLDVTDPQSFSAASVMVDRSSASNTSGGLPGDEDVGHIHAAPAVDDVAQRSEQIVKLNNGRWAVVMGNGVNSPLERPVLLIQYLDGNKGLVRLIASTREKQSNGLISPRLIDVNSDGKVDVAYAGDLQGQLWKFNLSGPSDADWGVSTWNSSGVTCRNSEACEPFFVAMDNATPAMPQAITTAPLWLAHPLGGIQLMFGTGRNLQMSDASDTQVQTIYSLWDKSGFDKKDGRLTLLDNARIKASDGRESLVRQDVIGTATGNGSGADQATPASGLANTTARTVAYTRGENAATRRGWYLDLPIQREQVLQAPVYFEGQKAIITSTVPANVNASEGCEGGILEDEHWLTVLNMISGWPSATPVFALPGLTASIASRARVNASEYITLPGAGNRLELISVRNGAGCTDRACTEKASLIGASGSGVRMDWREVQR